ncbi:MAG: integrase domain-containing protein [Methylococcales bacterium]|nr:integrase domain-containing protein [Methylococcales bacterium]
MSRNYGIGSRNMFVAGRMVLHRRSNTGFKTQHDYADRWRLFCRWASELNVKKMENVTPDVVVEYGRHLQSQLEAGVYASASAPKNYVSAVNAVMKLATGGKWHPVSPGKDCGIQKRVYIPTENKAITAADHANAQAASGARVAALLGLQRAFGLRFKESALLNAKLALKEASVKGFISVKAGTKGGRKRTVPCRPVGITALEQAVAVQDGRAMIPRYVTDPETGAKKDLSKDLNYYTFRQECYLVAGDQGFNFHSERHAYAQERYREITSAPSPIEAGWTRKERFKHLADYLAITDAEAREIDDAARQVVSEELGHSRVEITNAYLG